MKDDKKLLYQVVFMIGGQFYYIQYLFLQNSMYRISTLISLILLVLSLVFCFKRRSIGKLGAILGLIAFLEIRVYLHSLSYYDPNLGTVIQG